MKVLILKTGYSETLDPEISQSVSLGDVLRSTVIIHPFLNDHITWVTDAAATFLLNGIEALDRILVWDFNTALQLQAEKFDIIINLEKSPGIAALASKMDAWQKYGFRFDGTIGEARGYKHTDFETYMNVDMKKLIGKPWQNVLFEIIQETWNGEEYLLGMKPTSEPQKRVGLNFRIGRKWPNKAWPASHWDELFERLRPYSIWQEGERNFQDYVNWIHSCEVIVTNDSLGLHLAIALKKKFVALFGPTLATEVHDYGLGVKLVGSCEFAPCLEPSCEYDTCMRSITSEQVEKEVRKLLAA